MDRDGAARARQSPDRAPTTGTTEPRRHRCSSEPSDRGRSARSVSGACRCPSRAGPTRTARSGPSTPRSTPASPSSTRPTPTTVTRARWVTTSPSSPRRSRRGPGARPTCSSRPRAATCAPATARGRRTAAPTTSRRRPRPRSSGSAATRSGSTSSTGRTPTCPTPSPSVRSSSLLDEGVIEMAGISNADPAQIREAQDVLGGRLVSVQNQFSPAFRSSRAETDLCAEARHRLPAVEPARRHQQGGRPRQPARRVRGGREGPRREPPAGGARVGLALAPTVVPIPGASRPESIEDSVQAADLEPDGRRGRASLGRDARLTSPRGVAGTGPYGSRTSRRGPSPHPRLRPSVESWLASWA